MRAARELLARVLLGAAFAVMPRDTRRILGAALADGVARQIDAALDQARRL